MRDQELQLSLIYIADRIRCLSLKDRELLGLEWGMITHVSNIICPG